MAERPFGPTQVVTKLRQTEVLMGDGKSLQRAVREAGITDATDYRWRKEYSGLKGNQAQRPKELEREHAPRGSATHSPKLLTPEQPELMQ